MPELTELQKERISFHLDYAAAKYLLAITRDVYLITLNESQKLAVVGQEIDNIPLDNIYEFEGVPLCSNTSALGKVERAFDQLDPSVISDSLFVSEAGSVKLRGSETQKREKLYLLMVKYLAQLLGEGESSKRVGW